MFYRIRSLLGFERKGSLAAASAEMFALFGAAPTSAGAAVTPESALRCPTVYAAVKVIAEAVAQLPCHLYRRLADGGKERASDHPVAALLHDQANDWTSAFEFKLAMQTSLCLHGNAYAFINRRDGVVCELIPIPATSVTVELDAVTMEPRYRVTLAAGEQRVFDRAEILHLRTLGLTEHSGLSPVMQAREAIGLALAMERHAGRLFSDGARPGGLFKSAKVLGEAAIKRLRDSFSAANAGAENSGKTLVLEDGMDFVPLTFSSVDLQFLELRRHQVAEVARVFRVPLHMLQDLERTTHANAESLGQQFLALTLLPWLKLWEGAIQRSLLTIEERKTYYAEFLTDDIARADLAARFTSYAQAVTNGILAPNEIREMENRPPYAGGSQFRLPLNTATPDAANRSGANA